MFRYRIAERAVSKPLPIRSAPQPFKVGQSEAWGGGEVRPRETGRLLGEVLYRLYLLTAENLTVTFFRLQQNASMENV